MNESMNKQPCQLQYYKDKTQSFRAGLEPSTLKILCSALSPFIPSNTILSHPYAPSKDTTSVTFSNLLPAPPTPAAPSASPPPVTHFLFPLENGWAAPVKGKTDHPCVRDLASIFPPSSFALWPLEHSRMIFPPLPEPAPKHLSRIPHLSHRDGSGRRSGTTDITKPKIQT